MSIQVNMSNPKYCIYNNAQIRYLSCLQTKQNKQNLTLANCSTWIEPQTTTFDLFDEYCEFPKKLNWTLFDKTVTGYKHPYSIE